MPKSSTFALHQIPIFERLATSKTILLAGAGGGFDIYSGIPLYFSLKKQGKNVILANFSFTALSETTSEQVFPFCYKIRRGDSDLSGRRYFPERLLKTWFDDQGESVQLYAFERVGVAPLKAAYDFLIQKHNVDTVILVDGGTDSLMFGDEDGLGTPQEDICSMAAVFQSTAAHRYLISVGFGIDHFHGVSHYRFLENVAELAKDGGYLGLFQMTKEMEEVQQYMNAVAYANKHTYGQESIVCNSIVSALEGAYGDVHNTNRTRGSELWINPLMTLFWCFELDSVVEKIKYYDRIKFVHSIAEFNTQLTHYQSELVALRGKKQLPV